MFVHGDAVFQWNGRWAWSLYQNNFQTMMLDKLIHEGITKFEFNLSNKNNPRSFLFDKIF